MCAVRGRVVMIINHKRRVPGVKMKGFPDVLYKIREELLWPACSSVVLVHMKGRSLNTTLQTNERCSHRS